MKRMLILCLLLGVYAWSTAQNLQKWKGSDIQQLLVNTNKEIVVMNVWATFCKPCVEEIPHFMNLAKTHSDKVELILMSVDASEMFPNKLRRFIKKKRFQSATLGWLNETDANYFCPLLDSRWEGSIPATLIYDKKSGKRFFKEGSMSESELKEVLSQFL